MADFDYAFLICEFDEYDIESYPVGSGIPRYMYNKLRIKPKFIFSKLKEIQLKYDIIVYLCGSDTWEAKQTAFNIMKKIFQNV